MTNKFIIQNKLKYIFSNNNILLNSINFCKKNNIDDKHLKYIIQSIDKFLACRDMSKGFIKFKCPLCPIIHKFPLTCKSKLCPSCGFKYARIWSQNTMKHILNIEHRHVLFTIPKECRQFFFYDRKLLSKLSEAVNEIFKFCFHNISKKNLRKNKISKFSKKYFTDSDIVHYGLISIIHTFGRVLKWNPHIHAIVSLGGFNKNFDFRKMRHFNVDTIAGQWKYHVLKIIQNGEYHDSKIKKKTLELLKNFTGKTKDSSLMSVTVTSTAQRVLSDISEDTSHVSPVAEYKITEIDDDNVTFFFNDLANNKKKTYITMPAEKFISQILIHLPPKNFKMVNRYGFYSRHISDELKKAMEPFRKNIAVSKYSFYQRQMYITFGMNPFFCPECKIRMIVWEFYHYLYPPLKKYY